MQLLYQAFLDSPINIAVSSHICIHISMMECKQLEVQARSTYVVGTQRSTALKRLGGGLRRRACKSLAYCCANGKSNTLVVVDAGRSTVAKRLGLSYEACKLLADGGWSISRDVPWHVVCSSYHNSRKSLLFPLTVGVVGV